MNKNFRGRPTKMSILDINIMKHVLENSKNKKITVKEIMNRFNGILKQNQKAEKKINIIVKLIKKSNFTRKRCTHLNSEINSLEAKRNRIEKVVLMASYLSSEIKFIYLDESSFNTNIVPTYGFSVKNTKCTMSLTNRGYNISLISCVSENEILGFIIFKGSIKAKDVI